MEEIKRTEIASLGEFGLIERLTGHIQLKNTSTLKGVGDCLLYTSDAADEL